MISATWSVIFKTVLLFYMNLSSACLFSIRQLTELLPKITFQPSLLKRRHNLSSCFGVAYFWAILSLTPEQLSCLFAYEKKKRVPIRR